MAQQDRVLIVDDERINLNVLIELLSPYHEIIVAKSGRQALQRLEAETLPDLVLLDILMPDIDGFEVCRQIKENPRTADIPVIFISTLDSDLDEQRGLELGAADYISKPFSPALVRLRVRNHLKLKRHSDLLHNLATLDGLTSIPNRRRFDQAIETEWTHAAHYRVPLSLILMDIDCFKAYNDNYGHLAGDECLTQVAQTLAGAVSRRSDLVARYGGEEFVCLLPNIELDGAMTVAENFRAAVEALKIEHAYSKGGPHVTLSLGVATLVPREGIVLPSSLIEAADAKLYQAKEGGRNRVAG